MLNEARLQVFTHFVCDLAKLSKCTDKGTAAIVINADGTQVYSIGINGGPRHGLDCLCTLGGKYTCIHAEANAIAKCTSSDIAKIMICTLSPCVTCASMIINADIFAVYYLDDYKDDTGLKMLRDAGIRVLKVSDLEKE